MSRGGDKEQNQPRPITAATVLAAARTRCPDPRTVLLLVFICNWLVMSRTDVMLVYPVAAVAVLGLLWAGARKGAAVFIALEGFFLALYFLPTLWPSALSGILVVLGMWMAKLCAAGGIAAYAITVILPGELIAALRQLRIPRFVTVPLTVLLRFIPILFAEYTAVREAMALRGLSMGASAVLHPLRYLEFVLVPLLSSCARITDEMTAAAMVRGLGSKTRPSTMKDLRFRGSDLVIVAICIGLIFFAYHLARGISIPGIFG